MTKFWISPFNLEYLKSCEESELSCHNDIIRKGYPTNVRSLGDHFNLLELEFDRNVMRSCCAFKCHTRPCFEWSTYS